MSPANGSPNPARDDPGTDDPGTKEPGIPGPEGSGPEHDPFEPVGAEELYVETDPARFSFESTGGARGQASDIDIQAQEILKLRDRMNEILASHTGRPLEQIAADTERDYYMSAEEAQDYGIVDVVTTQRTPARSPKSKQPEGDG